MQVMSRVRVSDSDLSPVDLNVPYRKAEKRVAEGSSVRSPVDLKTSKSVYSPISLCGWGVTHSAGEIKLNLSNMVRGRTDVLNI